MDASDPTRPRGCRYAIIEVVVDFPQEVSSEEAVDDWLRALDKLVTPLGVIPRTSRLVGSTTQQEGEDWLDTIERCGRLESPVTTQTGVCYHPDALQLHRNDRIDESRTLEG